MVNWGQIFEKMPKEFRNTHPASPDSFVFLNYVNYVNSFEIHLYFMPKSTTSGVLDHVKQQSEICS